MVYRQDCSPSAHWCHSLEFDHEEVSAQVYHSLDNLEQAYVTLTAIVSHPVPCQEWDEEIARALGAGES